MVLSQAKPEARLKSAVIDRLADSGALANDSVLISELTVGNWTRRTDIVLANGSLWGFELKSESDSLTRLAGQVETFSNYFEKLIVVVAARFEEKAQKLLEESSAKNVGLWVESNQKIKERIRPVLQPLKSQAAIDLMTVVELRRVLSQNGVRISGACRRAELVETALELPAAVLAAAARFAIKNRFRGVFDGFMVARESTDTLSALHTLRRSSNAHVAPPEVQRMNAPRRALPSVPMGHPQLFNAPAGPVLARRVR